MTLRELRAIELRREYERAQMWAAYVNSQWHCPDWANCCGWERTAAIVDAWSLRAELRRSTPIEGEQNDRA